MSDVRIHVLFLLAVQRGDLEEARRRQARAVRLVHTIVRRRSNAPRRTFCPGLVERSIRPD